MTPNLLSIMTTAETSEETKEISALISEIERAQSMTHSMSASSFDEGLRRMASYRTKSSSSLKSGHVASWQRANDWASERVFKNEPLDWPSIQEINRILLCGRELVGAAGEVRTQEVYLGPLMACPLKKLDTMLDQFKRSILADGAKLHPLRYAALVQYWLVTLHPFWDANGRTAVMAADWILALDGHLPQTFSKQRDAVIAVLGETRTAATPARATLKVLTNVLRSYRLLCEGTGRLTAPDAPSPEKEPGTLTRSCKRAFSESGFSLRATCG